MSWDRKSVLLSGSLATVGFVVGRYWVTSASTMSLLLGRLASLESWGATHPLESGIVLAVIGALVVPFTVWVRKSASATFRRRTILDLLIQNEDRVHVVVSHMRQTSFKRISGQTVDLPSNAVFLPSSVALSLANLMNYAQEINGPSKPMVSHYDNEHWGAQEHTFLSIGGPFVNEIAKDILDRRLIPGFRIDDVPCAFDENDRFSAERAGASTAMDAPLAVDYGFLICMTSPWNAAKKVCVAFGLWPQGTLAAVNLAIERHPPRSDHFRSFIKAVKEDKNVIGVVRVTITGQLTGRGTLVKAREF